MVFVCINNDLNDNVSYLDVIDVINETIGLGGLGKSNVINNNVYIINSPSDIKVLSYDQIQSIFKKIGYDIDVVIDNKSYTCQKF